MNWIWAALMPHPPILLPEVGRGREKEAAESLKGVAALLERLKKMPHGGRPDVLMILSPHQPYEPGAFCLNTAPRLHGSMARFGAAEVSFSLQTDEAFERLGEYLYRTGLTVLGGDFPDLTPDHGTMAPLYFLAKNFDLPPVIVANPVGLAPLEALKLGRALASFNDEGRTWALLASGDLSHRLTPEAPAGYDPLGQAFDDSVVEALGSGHAQTLAGQWPPQRLAQAGECGFRSVMALLGLAGGPVETLSYEGPFGVGYCHALWRPGAEGRAPHPYPRLARLAVERYLKGLPADEGLPMEISAEASLWSPGQACFVSIKTAAGDLRGCIGTILPTRENLGREIMENAISAATRDPRFPPMEQGELAGARFSVDVLSLPEPVKSLNELDPARWGVIVDQDGRRGVLLPDLEGVDTVERQLSIACAKAGISDINDDMTIHRFSVERFKEGGDA